MGPRALCLLSRYWKIFSMVAWAGWVLQRNPPWIERRDAGGPTFAHHIQCDGGRSGMPMGVIGGGKRWGKQK